MVLASYWLAEKREIWWCARGEREGSRVGLDKAWLRRGQKAIIYKVVKGVVI